MSTLRLIFILSLVILAGVFIATVFFIPSEQEDYPVSNKAQIIEGDGEWILQYTIVNNEEREVEYNIVVAVDDAVYRESTVVGPGKLYTYLHHVYPRQLSEGRVAFTLYEEGKAEPIDSVTYYIQPK